MQISRNISLNYNSVSKIIENKLILSIFKWLWLIVIIPKEFQMIIFLLLSIYLLLKKNKNIRITIISASIMFYCLIYIFAILLETIRNIDEFEVLRLLAALNTNVMWLIVAILLVTMSKHRINKIEFDKIGKVTVINLFILFVIFVISKLLNLTEVNFLGLKLIFQTNDYLYGIETLRFQGLFEYTALVGIFTIIQLPIACIYLLGKKKIFFWLLILISIFPTISSNSRICILALFIELVFILFSLLRNTRILSHITLILVLLIVFKFLITKDYITILDKIFNMREGSNNTRFLIYETSLSYFMTNSPIIGVGIKYNYFGVPLGSHSTMIGVLYKTGFLGAIFFIIFIIFFFVY